MNGSLRIGAFGRQESVAAVWVCAFAGGCFAFDNQALFADGNASYLCHAVAALLSLLLFEVTVAAIRRRSGTDLFSLFTAKGKRILAVPLILSLLLSAMQPMQQFLLTVTRYVFVDAKQVSVCLYLLPCLWLLTLCGAETLVRTARVLLPILLLSVLIALFLGISQYRIDRLYPIPIGTPKKWFRDVLTALHRTGSPLLALLVLGSGTQRADALHSAGRIGAILGAVTATAMLFGLSLGFSYPMLSDMPAPFYRLLVEVRTENPTLRLDRAVLFLWMTGALLSSAIEIFAAGVCVCKAFGVRDVRPVVCVLSALTVSAILVLYYDSEPTLSILKCLYRDAWLLLVVPLPLLWIGRKERVCAA